MNFDLLKNKIEQATKQAFIEMQQQHGSDKIYAFALYSDEGAMTVCPSSNTQAFLATQDPEDLSYYKFEPAEWVYEMQGADEAFNQISTEVRLAVEQYDDDQNKFEAFRQQLFASCIEVLLKLKQENFFSNISQKDVFLMFSVSEYEYDRAALSQMISQLNDNAYCDEYLTWMKTWSD